MIMTAKRYSILSLFTLGTNCAKAISYHLDVNPQISLPLIIGLEDILSPYPYSSFMHILTLDFITMEAYSFLIRMSKLVIKLLTLSYALTQLNYLSFRLFKRLEKE